MTAPLGPSVRVSNAVVRMCWLTIVLSLIAATAGLFWGPPGNVFTFTSVHGEAVTIYGQGLYRNDTLLVGVGNRGTDAVTVLFEIPFLFGSLLLYRRGCVKGALLLLGALGYFLYYYASLAFGASYNALFPIYVALVALGLFSFVIVFSSIDVRASAALLSQHFPRWSVIFYLLATGTLLFAVWLPSSATGFLERQVPPELGSYTTVITPVLNLGIIAPAAFMAAAQLLRKNAAGYVLGSVFIVLNLTIGLSLIGQAAAQLWFHVPVTTSQVFGMMVSFAASTFVAAGFFLRIFGGLSTDVPVIERATAAQTQP